MQSTGQSSEKKSYRVILLLVVGLAAFSTAMKELNQVRELTMETSKLVAEWSYMIAPSEQITAPVKVETCENSQILAPPAAPVIPVQPVAAPEAEDADEPEGEEIVTPALTPVRPAPPKVAPVARPRRVVRQDHDSVEVRVLTSDEFVERSIKDALESDAMMKALKAKNRRHIFVT